MRVLFKLQRSKIKDMIRFTEVCFLTTYSPEHRHFAVKAHLSKRPCRGLELNVRVPVETGVHGVDSGGAWTCI